MIRLALSHAGYEVETAGDGPEGLQKFGDGSAWDVVLLDQRMPGMSGIDALKEIFQRRSDTRLILITAFGTIDLALEAIQSGASDFLRKPFTTETLKTSVRSALERPVQHLSAVPVGLACREFTRTAINGFSFDLFQESTDDTSGDMTCDFRVSKGSDKPVNVRVVLPAYVMELVLAYTDSETVPGGSRFWQAMCEESLANYLWQNAELPEHNSMRIEDLSTSLQRWLDSVLTVPLLEEHAI
jgi:CheY-like chemotaxis protein